MPDKPCSTHQALLMMLGQLAAFGATANGGVARLAASQTDGDARDFLCEWLREQGGEVLIDRIGNILGVFDLGVGENTGHFFCGSHLDTQPEGGRFDGALGVACACLAALTLRDQVKAGCLAPTCRFLVVVCWTGEEGARFQPSLIGSSAFTGYLPVDQVLGIQDAQGTSLAEALSAIGYQGSATVPLPSHYLELHIEQGCRLELANKPIGLVTGSWGAKKLVIDVLGKPDHTGPTPMDHRCDALLAASQLVVRVHALAQLSPSPLHCSVGRMDIAPNSPNTVAERVSLWVEMRSASAITLEKTSVQLQQAMDEISASTRTAIRVSKSEDREAIIFDQASRQRVEAAWIREKIPHLALTTIAGHDAIRLQSICPSTLLFVPSKDGISHSPEEFTSDEAVCAGFDAMMHAMSALMEDASAMDSATGAHDHV